MRFKTLVAAWSMVACLGLSVHAQQDLIELVLEVPHTTNSPMADGTIGEGEYGSSFFFSFGDEENPGNPFPSLNKMCSIDCSLDEVETEDDDDDLSANLHMTYTDEYLFLGFEVTDQFINEDSGTPFNNDSVELAIDADADGNDGRNWSREGFKITADVLGQLSDDGGGTDDNSILPEFEPDPEEGFYYAAADVTDTGYNIEFQIPLASMDTFDEDPEDGLPDEEFTPAAPGDVLRMNFGINDIDLEFGGQNEGTHGMAWVVEDNPASPWGGAEEVWAVGLELVEPDDGLVGDYNGNGEYDSEDLDIQAGYIKDGVADGDLDNDGDTDAADRVLWIETLQGSYVGDANFDGEFNSGDLVSTFTAGKYESGQAATYAEGDFDGDMQFSSADFVVAFAGGGYEQGPRAATASVPEPAGVALMLLGVLGLVSRRR